MSKRQGEAAAPELSAVATKKVRPEVPPGSFDALPLDLLIDIFATIPVRARIYTISVVCKRWRSAALRRINAISIVHGSGDPAPLVSLLASPAR